MNDRHEEISMQRRDDDLATKVLRVVDWKWFLGLCGFVAAWAISQWINYNALLTRFDTMSLGFTSLVTEVKQISEQLTSLKIADLKHDGEIARLKDQVTEIQAWKQSKQNGTSK